MDWVQILTIIGTFLTLLSVMIIIYFKLDTKIDNLAAKMDLKMDKFADEVKDFHTRLCVLESRYLDILEKK